MKKIITVISLTLATVSLSFAASFLEVISLENINGQTKVSVKRYESNPNQDNFTGAYLFNGIISMQQAVTKMSYFADGGINVIGKNASSTTGQVNVMAKLRSDAWYAKGLNGYFTELARQLDLIK
jgi:hypothetical protein